MVKLQAGIEKVKEDYSQIIPPEAIVGNCRRIGHQFRQRKCGPVETFYLFLIQVLNGNVACGALRHVAGGRASATTSCGSSGFGVAERTPVPSHVSASPP